jgi:hypothetical protein
MHGIADDGLIEVAHLDRDRAIRAGNGTKV